MKEKKKMNVIDRSRKQMQSKALSQQMWLSATILLVFASLLSKALGLLREVLIARNFGVSADMDAYMVAVSLPSILGGAIGSALGISLIPLYHKALSTSDGDKANDLIRSTVTFTALVSITLGILVCLGAGNVVRWVAPDLPEYTREVAILMLRWLSVLIVGLSLFNVLSCTYNAFHHFKIPAFVDLLSNVIVIATLFLFTHSMGVYSLVTGMAASTMIVATVLFGHLYIKGVAKYKTEFKKEEFKELIAYAGPIVCFTVISQFNGMIENFFASSLQEGSIAILGYSKRLFDILPSLIVVSVAKSIFPTLSNLAAEKKRDELREIVVKFSKQLIIFFIPLSVWLIYFSQEIIQLVFMRGQFSTDAVYLTSDAFRYFVVGLTAYAMTIILLRLSYAFSDNTSPLKAIGAATLSMIVFDYFAVPFFGVNAIAFGSSLSALIYLLVLATFMRQKLGGLGLRGLAKIFLTSSICAALALTPLLLVRVHGIHIFILLSVLYFVFYMALGFFSAKSEFGVFWRVVAKVTRLRLRLG
jgi:putative peptidoglycan lipid II flippase